MPTKNPNLHGNVPDKSAAALLIIDVINDLEWSGGDRIYDAAMRMATAIARLKKCAKALGIPTIYVNDNFGRWQSDFKNVVDHVIQDGTRGGGIAKMLQPEGDDYFVLKPKHSGFFSTTLDTLLDYLKVKTVILAGLQTNICVLFTANEAYMRDFDLYVPEDCSAAERTQDHDYAMEQMRRILKADTRPSKEIDLESLTEGERRKQNGASDKDAPKPDQDPY